MHDQNRNPLLYLLINCKSTGSGTQILFLNDEYALRFSNLKICSLCNAIVDSWYDIISLLIANLSHVIKVSEYTRVTALSEDLLSKRLLTIKASSFWLQWYFGFLAILLDTLFEDIFIGKS